MSWPVGLYTLAYLLSLGTRQKLHLEMHQPIKWETKWTQTPKLNLGFQRVKGLSLYNGSSKSRHKESLCVKMFKLKSTPKHAISIWIFGTFSCSTTLMSKNNEEHCFDVVSYHGSSCHPSKITLVANETKFSQNSTTQQFHKVNQQCQ